ncbi:hypothetical protein [Sphingomonas hankookensis]|uniref:hypothetical protein n=1 Tax=Sphingomonas hankookensis TaxID=563996 RepID=UPI003F7B1F8E
MTSILGKAREEAYRQGWNQAMQVSTDDAFADGQQAAWADAPRRITWACIGMIAGALLQWILG